MLRDLTKIFSQGYVRNIHQDQVTIALQHEYVSNCKDFGCGAGFFICIHCLPWYNARLQMLCVLFPHRLNNCRRVAYEEVRLPPASNQRCDLYVDDEVEVRLANGKPVWLST